jgi:hypothetical protein
LVGGVGSLPQRTSLIQRARHKGVIKEQALNNITLRLQVGYGSMLPYPDMFWCRSILVSVVQMAKDNIWLLPTSLSSLQSVHSWSSQASSDIAAVLPGVSTLVLRDCIIPAAQLQPLLISGTVTCVRLEGNSNLSDDLANPGQGLLDLLIISPALKALELTGVTQHFRPAAPPTLAPPPGPPADEDVGGGQQLEGAEAGEGGAVPPAAAVGVVQEGQVAPAEEAGEAPAAHGQNVPAAQAAGDAPAVQAHTILQLPPLSTRIKRLTLTCSGSLQAWAPVLHRLPALECLEVATSPGAPEDFPYLADILPTFSTVKTLHLPDVTISGGGDGAVLRALLQMPALQDVQVGKEGPDSKHAGDMPLHRLLHSCSEVQQSAAWPTVGACRWWAVACT